MPMHALAARFAVVPAKDVLRARLHEELGEDADQVSIDWKWQPKKKPTAAYRGEQPEASLLFQSTDIVALLYVKKICLALGGEPYDAGTGALKVEELPPWSKVPWTHHHPLERLRIRLNVIRL